MRRRTVAAAPVVTAAPAATPAPVKPPVAAPVIALIAGTAAAAKVALPRARLSAHCCASNQAGNRRCPSSAKTRQKFQQLQQSRAESQSEIDVRPWSAGAPWRAAEPPTPSWSTRLNRRANEFVNEALKGIAARVLRAGDAGTAAWTKTARGARSAAAAFVAKTASFLLGSQSKIAPIISRARRAAVAAVANALHVTRTAGAQALAKARPASRSAVAPKAAAIPTPTRAPQTPTSIFAAPSARTAIQAPQATLFEASREKLASASTGLKNASSRALYTVIPREPSRGELGTMAAITLLLLAGLAAFTYRDKFEFPAASIRHRCQSRQNSSSTHLLKPLQLQRSLLDEW